MLLNRTRKLLSLGLSIVSQVLPLLTMLVTYAWFAAVQKGELVSPLTSSISKTRSDPSFGLETDCRDRLLCNGVSGVRS